MAESPSNHDGGAPKRNQSFAMVSGRLSVSVEADGGDDADDGDFGLADWQLEDLWKNFEESAERRVRSMTDADDADMGPRKTCRDSDFGLSDEQLQQLLSIDRQAEMDRDLLQAQLKELEQNDSVESLQDNTSTQPAAASGYSLEEQPQEAVAPTASSNAPPARTAESAAAAAPKEAAPEASAPAPAPALASSPSTEASPPVQAAAAASSAAPVSAASAPAAAPSASPSTSAPPAAAPSASPSASPPAAASTKPVSTEPKYVTRKSFGTLDAFLGEKAPEMKLGSNWKATILSRRELEGCTWYLINVKEGNEERFYMKQLTDFEDFDDVYRPAMQQGQLSEIPLPALPKGGLMGSIKGFLGGNDFHTERRRGLQNYLDALSRFAFKLTDGDPALTSFLGPEAYGRVHPGRSKQQAEEALL